MIPDGFLKPEYNVILWGNGYQSKILQAMLKEIFQKNIAAIIDPKPPGLLTLSESKILVSPLEICAGISDSDAFFVGIAGTHGFARSKTADFLKTLGKIELSIIHPTAYIDLTSKIGDGSQIMPKATVHKFVQIGRQNIINTSATIDHDCVTGEGVHIMGSAAIAGCVTLEDFVTIGTNSTILPRITIGAGAIVGAGAVVTKNVASNDIVAGVPAVKIGESTTSFNPDLITNIQRLYGL